MRRLTLAFSGRPTASEAPLLDGPLEGIVRQLARVHALEHTPGKHRVLHLRGSPRSIKLGRADAGCNAPATPRFVPFRSRRFSAAGAVATFGLSWFAMDDGSTVPQSFIIRVSRGTALCVGDLQSIGKARSTTPSSGCVRCESGFLPEGPSPGCEGVPLRRFPPANGAACFCPGDARARMRLDARELKHW